MSDVTLGTVTAKTTTDNTQFDAGMQKSSEVIKATARENAKAAKLQADAIAFAAKFSGDAVSDQSMRIVASLKMQSLAEADLRRAKEYSKSLDEAGSTKLLAASYQRLAASRLESAAAARVETAATEASVLTQRQAVSAVVRASEGQQGIRAVEGFMTMLPGVGSAMQALFPLVGGAMFISMLVKMGTELYDLEQKGKHSAEELDRAFGEFNDRLQASNDELAVTDSKLRDEIDNLSGHPSNGLETAMLEAKIAADKLQESLGADVKTLQALLKEHDVSFVEGALAGVRPTGPASDAINEHLRALEEVSAKAKDIYDAEADAAKSAHDKAVEEAGKNHAALRAADDTYSAAKQAAQRKSNEAQKQAALDFSKWNEEQAAKVAKPSAAKQLAVGGALALAAGPLGTLVDRAYAGDPDQTRRQYQDAARTGHSIANRVDLSDSIFSDTQTVDSLRQKKATGTIENSAQHKQFDAMKAALEQQKMLHGETLAEEESYWQKMLAVAKPGSELYKLIVPEVVKAQQAIVGEFTRGAIQAADAATRESTEIHDALMKTWGDGNKQDSQTAREQYAAVSAIRAGAADDRLRDLKGSDQVRELQLRMAPAGDAARQTAAMHTAEYNESRSDLNDKMTRATSMPGDTDAEKAERLRQVEALKKESAELEHQHTLQQAEDEQRIESTTLMGGANDALREFVMATTNAGAEVKNFLTGSLNTVNSAIVKVLTTPHTTGREAFGAAGHEIFTSATSSLLNGAEGSLMKGLGLGGKSDGSSEANALWVRMTSGANKHAAATAALKLPGVIPFNGSGGKGGGGLFGTPNELGGGDAGDTGDGGGNGSASTSVSGFNRFLSKLFGKGATDGSSGSGVMSSLAGIALHLIPGFANGGDYPTNSLIQVGERGPEIMRTGSTPGTIIPNHALGGSGDVNLHFHTDARGATDPAQVEAAIARSHRVMGPKYVAAAMHAMQNRNARLPSSRRS